MIAAACKKIWKLDHPVLCRLIGVTIDRDEAENMVKKFNLTVEQGYHRPFMVHQSILVHLRNRNPVSLHVQRLLKNRLDRYRTMLSHLSWHQLMGAAEAGHVSGVPVGGVIWAALNHPEAPSDIADRLFAVIHMREHEALKMY